MSLRVLILTTETPHHAFFVRQLVDAGHEVSAFVEQPSAESAEGQGEFEASRHDFELSRWFGGRPQRLDELCATRVTDSVNGADSLALLRRTTNDVAISFGTGWIRNEALRLMPPERWNLHGGDPQKYRGLDSHLWALYHQDPAALVTTVHALETSLDTGEIIAGSRIDLSSAREMYMLRAANTELAADLVRGCLAHLEAVGRVPRMPQAAIGRYYSALPASLLPICAKRYAATFNSQVCVL